MSFEGITPAIIDSESSKHLIGSEKMGEIHSRIQRIEGNSRVKEYVLVLSGEQLEKLDAAFNQAGVQWEAIIRSDESEITIKGLVEILIINDSRKRAKKVQELFGW